MVECELVYCMSSSLVVIIVHDQMSPWSTIPHRDPPRLSGSTIMIYDQLPTRSTIHDEKLLNVSVVFLAFSHLSSSCLFLQWEHTGGHFKSTALLWVYKQRAMPTVVLMDVSLSMTRPVSLDNSEEFQRKNLAVHGLNMLFEHMASNYRLEFTALMAFSSLWELLVPFTRDYNALQVKCASYVKRKVSLTWALKGIFNECVYFCAGGSEQPGRLWQDLCGISSSRR